MDTCVDRPQGFPFIEDKPFGQSEVMGVIFPDGSLQYSSRRGGACRTPTTYPEGRKFRLLYFDMREREIRRLMGDWGKEISYCEESPGTRDFDGSKRANAREHVKQLQDELVRCNEEREEFVATNP